MIPITPVFITQKFGVNPQDYKQYGLKGHNGLDLRTKYPDTPTGIREVLSPYDSDFYKRGDEGTIGYGLYSEHLVQLKSLWKLTYAHCHRVEKRQYFKKGEVVGLSNNTGNSTASHLHWTVKRVKWNGAVLEVLDYNNGYKGAVDPQEFIDELKEIETMAEITDQTKINLGPEIGIMEVQAIRSSILDSRKAIANLSTKIEICEKTHKTPPVTSPSAPESPSLPSPDILTIFFKGFVELIRRILKR